MNFGWCEWVNTISAGAVGECSTIIGRSARPRLVACARTATPPPPAGSSLTMAGALTSHSPLPSLCFFLSLVCPPCPGVTPLDARELVGRQGRGLCETVSCCWPQAIVRDQLGVGNGRWETGAHQVALSCCGGSSPAHHRRRRIPSSAWRSLPARQKRAAF